MDEPVVLLAEDDDGHAELLRRAVAKSEVACRLVVVHDGVELIETLFGVSSTGGEYRDPPLLPDLILLDLKMPRMTGLQVLQVLRRVRGSEPIQFVPVVVLTSSEQDTDIQEAYRLGAQSYICKPTNFDEFSTTVANTLRYWLSLNHASPRRRVPAHPLHAAEPAGAFN